MVDEIVRAPASSFFVLCLLGTQVCKWIAMSLGMVGQDWPHRYSELLSNGGIYLSGPIRHPTQKTYFWHGRYNIKHDSSKKRS
jgi:hypothetical protein